MSKAIEQLLNASRTMQNFGKPTQGEQRSTIHMRHRALGELKRLTIEEPDLDSTVINNRIEGIKQLYEAQSKIDYAGFLHGLYVAKQHIEKAIRILDTENKRRYEAVIKSALMSVEQQFKHLHGDHLGFILAFLDIPPRRSAHKDKNEALESLETLNGAVWRYRYLFTDERYGDHARMIGTHTTHEESFSPELTGLLVTEAKAIAKDELALIALGFPNREMCNIAARSMWNELGAEHLYGFVESLVGMFLSKTEYM